MPYAVYMPLYVYIISDADAVLTPLRVPAAPSIKEHARCVRSKMPRQRGAAKMRGVAPRAITEDVPRGDMPH